MELKKLLSSDHVLKTIKPSLAGSVSAPKSTPNVLEALRRLIYLLAEAGFTAKTFNEQTLQRFNHDRVLAARKSLFKTLSPIIDIPDPGDTRPRQSAPRINESS